MLRHETMIAKAALTAMDHNINVDRAQVDLYNDCTEI